MTEMVLGTIRRFGLCPSNFFNTMPFSILAVGLSAIFTAASAYIHSTDFFFRCYKLYYAVFKKMMIFCKYFFKVIK